MMKRSDYRYPIRASSSDRLKKLKCDEMQGHLFSKPVPAEQVPALLARGESAKVMDH